MAQISNVDMVANPRGIPSAVFIVRIVYSDFNNTSILYSNLSFFRHLCLMNHIFMVLSQEVSRYSLFNLDHSSHFRVSTNILNFTSIKQCSQHFFIFLNISGRYPYFCRWSLLQDSWRRWSCFEASSRVVRQVQVHGIKAYSTEESSSWQDPRN